jgi:hypothetical protein
VSEDCKKVSSLRSIDRFTREALTATEVLRSAVCGDF